MKFNILIIVLVLFANQNVYAFSSLPNITLYGRVIDQYEQPVINANVYYAGTNTFMAAGGGRGVVITDANGYFEIDTSGERLSLWGIRHPEVEEGGYAKPTNTNMDIKSSNMYPDWSVHNTKDNPYIILAWRLGKYKGAVKGGGSFGVYSGKIYTIFLTHSNVRKRIQEDLDENGDMQIICTREHMKSNRDYGNWSLSISLIKGELQKTNDFYMNIAPDNGYQPKLEVNMNKNSKDYMHALSNKRYYFRTNDRATYGSFTLEAQPFVTPDKEACSIRVYAKVNRTGSRNLELSR